MNTYEKMNDAIELMRIQLEQAQHFLRIVDTSLDDMEEANEDDADPGTTWSHFDSDSLREAQAALKELIRLSK